MPITDELKSINMLEAAGLVGFDRVVEVLEQKLTAFELRMREEFQSIRTEMQTIRTGMQTMRGDLLKEQRDQMLKFAALVSLIALVTGTMIRLF
ncbi:MAG: hypothetical protein IIC13_01600 [SAR324 cluster bacterium]|nr:hypothetical protein [SAR324 cluster bacterium]